MARLIITALGVSCAASSVATAERNPLPLYLDRSVFEQVAHKRGVRVYKHRSSDIIRIGAEVELPAPPARVQAALLDYRRQIGRIDRLSEAQVLSQAPGSLVVYQRLNLPVISDRDFTLHVRYGGEGDARWVSYRALKHRGPKPRDGIVRVTYHMGSWQLEPARDGNATHLRYQLSIDLGGWLPKWLARSGAGKELPELMSAICKLSNPDRRYGKCP